MAKKEGNRPKITLACTECKRRNYQTVKNRVNDRDRTARPASPRQVRSSPRASAASGAGSPASRSTCSAS